MTFSTPSRAALQSFIKDDPRTLKAFEELFGKLAGGDAFMPGDIVWSAAASRAGALLADGASYLRTLYPDLFAAIGTTYGAVDALHFNVPDITGRVVAGKEAADTRLTVAGSGIHGGTLGAAGGSEKQVLNVSQIPPHTHNVNVISTPTPQGTGAGNPVPTSTANVTTDGGTGGGLAHPNVQPTIVLNVFIIT